MVVLERTFHTIQSLLTIYRICYLRVCQPIFQADSSMACRSESWPTPVSAAYSHSNPQSWPSSLCPGIYSHFWYPCATLSSCANRAILWQCSGDTSKFHLQAAWCPPSCSRWCALPGPRPRPIRWSGTGCEPARPKMRPPTSLCMVSWLKPVGVFRWDTLPCLLCRVCWF